MRKSILFITILISINCFSQNKITDILNDFKPGSSYENSQELEEIFTNKKDGLKMYDYVGNKILKIENIDVNNIRLGYFENKLMTVEINFGDILSKDSFETSEFNKVKESLTLSLGKSNYEKSNPNPQIINEIDWTKLNININLKRLNYKYENSNYILGYILITENKISEKFMANLKR